MLIFLLILTSLVYGLGFKEALEKLKERNPEIKALNRMLEAYKGREISAKAYPNPELRFESGFFSSTEDLKPGGRFIYTLEVSQRLPLWGVRSKRLKLSILEKEIFSYEVQQSINFIISELYTNFYEALFRKELLKIEEENLKISKEIKDFVENAYMMGERTQLELLRARRVLSQAKIQLDLLKNEYEISLKKLSSFIKEKVEDVEGNLFNVPKTVYINLEETPRIKGLLSKVRFFEKRIDLEKALSKPQPSVGILMEDSDKGYYGFRVSLSFEMPLMYRRQGEILQNLELKKATEYSLEAEKLRLKALLEATFSKINVLRKSIEHLEKNLIPNAQKELHLGIKSYRLNVISLLELSDIKRRYFELLKERAKLYFELHKAYAQLIKIGGLR
ncbi:MAG TPA: TolC family protein [Aquificaceae bacterium]|nr:TolC family protein [Aquificaceae bacterium]HIQ48467.1 TolC family protein [Aquifex aeolicus]